MAFAASVGRVFPPPPYLALPGAGVDVSAGSVRAIAFGWRGVPAVVLCEKVGLPEGVVVGGEIEKPDALVDVLRTFRLKHRIRFAHASLPERKAFLYQTLVPSGEHDLRGAVEFDLEAHVPIPPAEAVFDFEPVRRVEAGTVVSVTAYALRVVESYRDAFRRAVIAVLSFEVESQAIARSIIAPDDRGHTILIVDFGRLTTRIAIADHGVAAFTATIDVGGDALTAAVMKHFKVEAPEAETIKNERGFLEGAENRELYEALMTTVSVLKDEITKHIAYWGSTDDAVPRQAVDRILVVGGNANLKGLPEYLSRVTALPVKVANVWTNAFSLDNYVPAIAREASLEYATAAGLALRARPTTPW